MGINHDEFSEGIEPIKPINAKPTTAEGGGGNGAAGNGTAGAPLEPNRADINAHLRALFHPTFVLPYPDAWIEIAIANPGGDRAKAVTTLTHRLLAYETLRQALVEPIIRNIAAGSIATVVHHRRGAG